MKTIIHTQNLNPDGTGIVAEIDIPSKCPACNVAYMREPEATYHIDSETLHGDETTIYALFFCPHCEKCFLVRYHAFHAYSSHMATVIYQIYPTPEMNHDFPESIKKISPRFINIFHQSEKAESEGLNEICGMGYRKSLEFLVKDFAIHLHPDLEDSIGKASLSQCIDNYVDNKKIQSLAKASAWIGNDETHYIRKHNDYNIQHLKLFITAVVTFIESELAYEESMTLLSSQK